MRATTWMIMAIAGSLAGHEAARAADAPGFVIPGKPGVPVIINGYDASYSMSKATGDSIGPPAFHRPSCPDHCWLPPPARYDGGYFPGDGEEPGYGRLEFVPPPKSAAAAARAAISSQLGHSL